jgi:hypothetical protein
MTTRDEIYRVIQATRDLFGTMLAASVRVSVRAIPLDGLPETFLEGYFRDESESFLGAHGIKPPPGLSIGLRFIPD